MEEKIKFGLVGVGVPKKDPKWKARMHYPKPSIAWIRYLPQISSNPRAELWAICDVVEERLHEVKKVYEVKETYTDYRDMLENSDVDVVVIHCQSIEESVEDRPCDYYPPISPLPTPERGNSVKSPRRKATLHAFIVSRRSPAFLIAWFNSANN